METWDCKHCERRIKAHSNDELKENKNDHLVENHRSELEKEFKNSWAGKGCQSCGKNIPDKYDTEDYLRCPHCGHDHARYWAGFGTDASTWDIG